MHNNHSLFGFLGNRELNELYISVAIRAFAISLIGVFIPIYLYQLGYSFQSIFIFFAFYALYNLIFMIPAAKISCRIGLKHSILVSMPFLIIFFLLLFSIEKFNWSLYFITFFGGVHSALFWFSFHTDFSRFSEKKKRGSQVGFSKIVVSVFSAVAPLLGGLILYYFSFKILFIIVAFLLFISTYPLFLSKEVHEPLNISLKDFFKGQKIKNIVAYIGSGMETRIGSVIWPLFIFIFILQEGYVSLGTLSSVGLFFTIAATFTISKVSDLNLKFFLKVGSLLTAIIWLIKSFVKTPLQLFVIEGFYGISLASLNVPFDAINYNKANRSQRARIILEREIYIKIGAITIMFLAAIFTEQLTNIFRYAGPLSSLMHFFF